MHRNHMPRVDPRYWAGITLASIFGTNLGDLYAHDSGLGIGWGLAVLAVLAGAAFLAERCDRSPRELYYWLVIVIIRTGATNIADYLAFRVRVPAVPLAAGLAALIALLAWGMSRTTSRVDRWDDKGLPETGAAYWSAMLAAGVFGTVLGDVCSHALGQGVASIVLGSLLGVVLIGRWRGIVAAVGGYWLTIAVARTAGTAMGDWLAENGVLNMGLAVSTLLTGCAFVLVLVVFRERRRPSFAG